MKVFSRAKVVGGSIMVTIPREAVKEQGIIPGQLLEIEVGKFKKSFFGAFAGVGPFTKEDELDTHG